MKELAIEEAGAQFSALLESVERGEEIRFTRNGEVVAELTPPRTVRDPARIDRAFAEIRERVKEEGVQSIGAATMKEWIHEGRL